MPFGCLYYNAGWARRYPVSDNCPTGRSNIHRGFHPKKDGSTRTRPRNRR